MTTLETTPPLEPSIYRHSADTQRADPQARCRAVAAHHDVAPDEAADCVLGSVGCPDCPWQSGWSPKYLSLYGIEPKRATHNTRATR